MTGKRKILLLRHRQGALRSRQKLEQAGYGVELLPMSVIEMVSTPFPKSNYDAMIFTSSRTPHALKDSPQFELISKLPVNCVGVHSAKKARDAGFNVVEFAPDGERLAEIIAKSGHASNVLYPCAKDISYDFTGFLAKHNVGCQNWQIYANSLIIPTPDEIVTAIENSNTVFLHSKRIARHFFVQIGKDARVLLANHKFIAISSNVTTEVPKFLQANTFVSAEKTEQSMCDMLDSVR